jgi:hypothetical protein
MGTPGADCSVIVTKRGNTRGARGQVTGVGIVRVHGQPEELAGPDGRRQPSIGGTSRISREAYVRICKRLGVQSPGRLGGPGTTRFLLPLFMVLPCGEHGTAKPLRVALVEPVAYLDDS